jgi:hypothetical protein
MPLAWGKLMQDAPRSPFRLGAFLTAQRSFKGVDRRILRASENGEVYAAHGLAPGALDFKPWKAAVDRLSDHRRGRGWPSVRPHSLIPALTGPVVGLPNDRLALDP